MGNNKNGFLIFYETEKADYYDSLSLDVCLFQWWQFLRITSFLILGYSMINVKENPHGYGILFFRS